VTLVLLVLAGIWAAVLIPPAVRARAEGRPGDSIHNFKRQLTVLRRTGPHRASLHGGGRVAGGDHWYRSHASALTPVHGPLRSTRTAPVAAYRAPASALRSTSAASAARSRTIRRRRDILSALLVASFATLLLGVLFSMGIMLVAHVVADVLLVAYVALLVHQRNVAAERDMKVRFLPQPHRLDPALLRAEPALLRRSAN
jgi:hypothetical protein